MIPGGLMLAHRMPTICIVEDDPVLSFLLEEICKASGCRVLGTARDLAGASCMLDNAVPDVLLLDYSLDGGEDGLELLTRARRDYPAMQTVLVTGWDIDRLAARIDFIAPDHVLQKPVMPQDIIALLGTLTDPHREPEFPPEFAEAA